MPIWKKNVYTCKLWNTGFILIFFLSVGIVPFHCNAVTLLPEVPDQKIKVTVNGGDSSQQIPLNFGDTTVEISVRSADGTNTQVAGCKKMMIPEASVLIQQQHAGNCSIFQKGIQLYGFWKRFRPQFIILITLHFTEFELNHNNKWHYLFAFNLKKILFDLFWFDHSVCQHHVPNVPSLCQVYTVLVTHEPIPMSVTFTDEKQQLDYECPVSLNVFYRPVSINNRYDFKKKHGTYPL